MTLPTGGKKINITGVYKQAQPLLRATHTQPGMQLTADYQNHLRGLAPHGKSAVLKNATVVLATGVITAGGERGVIEFKVLHQFGQQSLDTATHLREFGEITNRQFALEHPPAYIAEREVWGLRFTTPAD